MTKVNVDASASFRTLFNELRTTRSSYEALRSSGGTLCDRVNHLEHLHSLRAELATARQGTGL